MSYWQEQQQRNQQRRQWVEGLKAGDEVAICHSSSWSTHYNFSVVERRTATQIIVKGKRYRAKDGEEVGSAYAHRGRLDEPTLELKQQVADEEERRTLLSRIEAVKWRNVDLAHLRAVAAVLPEQKEAINA